MANQRAIGVDTNHPSASRSSLKYSLTVKDSKLFSWDVSSKASLWHTRMIMEAFIQQDKSAALLHRHHLSL